MQYAFARHPRRRRDERSQAVIHPTALGIADTSEQVPEGKRITLAGLREDEREAGVALCRRVGLKIELG